MVLLVFFKGSKFLLLLLIFQAMKKKTSVSKLSKSKDEREEISLPIERIIKLTAIFINNKDNFQVILLEQNKYFSFNFNVNLIKHSVHSRSRIY